MMCISLGCEKHPIYSPKSVHKTPKNKTIKIGVLFKLFDRVRVELGVTALLAIASRVLAIARVLSASDWARTSL